MTTWLYTSALTTALQTYALLWSCCRLFRERVPLPRSLALKTLLFLAADGAVCLGVYLLDRFLPLTGMAYAFLYTLLAQFAMCSLLFGGDGFAKLFHLLFANVAFTGVLMVARFSKDALLPPGALPTPLQYALVVNVLPQCAAIALLLLLQRRVNLLDFPLSPPRFYWFFSYAVYALLYFGMMYSADALLHWQLISGLSVLLELALLVMSVVFYSLILSVCRSYGEKLQHSLMQQQYELQKAHFAEIQSANRALRDLRHELKNYMFYMNHLIDQEDFDALRRFFAGFYQKEYHSLFELNTSDSFLDAVLEQKAAYARSFGIDVRLHVLLPEDGTLNNLDLCIILSNLLDNAVEACRGLSEPEIAVQLKRVKDSVSVVVENSAGQDVLKLNPQLETSKADKELHGIGLRVIRQIVERYDGSMHIDSDARSFRVMLMLNLPSNQESEVSS